MLFDANNTVVLVEFGLYSSQHSLVSFSFRDPSRIKYFKCNCCLRGDRKTIMEHFISLLRNSLSTSFLRLYSPFFASSSFPSHHSRIPLKKRTRTDVVVKLEPFIFQQLFICRKNHFMIVLTGKSYYYIIIQPRFLQAIKSPVLLSLNIYNFTPSRH